MIVIELRKRRDTDATYALRRDTENDRVLGIVGPLKREVRRAARRDPAGMVIRFADRMQRAPWADDMTIWHDAQARSDER